MLKNYLKIAWRSLINNKVYSFICVFGLALGISCSLLLYLYVKHELSYDRYHENPNDLYAVKATFTEKDKSNSFVGTPGAVAETIKKDYPVVQEAVRFTYGGTKTFIFKENKIQVEQFSFVDAAFFEILTYPFLSGNRDKALQEPNSLVLTQTLAEKLFGRAEEALDKTVIVSDRSYLVTGVVKDTPDNTIFPFEALASINTIPLERLSNYGAAGWLGIGCHTLVRLHKGADYKALNAQMPELKKYYQDEWSEFGVDLSMELISLLDVKLTEEDGGNTTLVYIYIISTIAIFILIIATINYINLATARSVTRAREVGIRKVVGSYRWQLVGQFLMESALIVTFSIGFGLFLAEIMLPFFNNLSGKALSLTTFLGGSDLLVILGLAILLSIVSGLYPAFVLSAFDPVKVLKGKFTNTRKGIRFRQGLVTFQFTVSVIMMIATWGVFQQMNYIFNKDLGFNREQIVTLDLSKGINEKGAIFRERMMENSNIQSATLSSLVPSYNDATRNFWKAVLDDGTLQDLVTDIVYAGYDYTQTLDIQIIEGRDFSPKIASDCTKAVVVNEAFLREVGWENGVGHEVEQFKSDKRYKIIGVMKDFHIYSLHEEIQPVIMHFDAKPWSLIMKVNEKDMKSTLAHMEKVWGEFEQDEPFEANFLNQSFADRYQRETNQSKIFLSFSFLAIFIASLGLFGLATYTVHLRRKEIGIRKVLGAGVSQIIRLLSGDFLKLVFLASLISIPIAYYLLGQWLQNFAYRISLGQVWYVFLGAGLLATLMSILTIGIQTLNAAQTNPVKILRDE